MSISDGFVCLRYPPEPQALSPTTDLDSRVVRWWLLFAVLQCREYATEDTPRPEITAQQIKHAPYMNCAPDREEEYGAQPHIEILRLWFDQGGRYNRRELTYREMSDDAMVCSMAPPRGGR